MKKKAYVLVAILVMLLSLSANAWSQSVSAKSNKLTPGEYTIPISILDSEDDSLEQYFHKSAKLHVTNEKLDIFLEIEKDFSKLSYVLDDKEAEMELISTDEEEKRVVRFSVANLDVLDLPIRATLYDSSNQPFQFTLHFDTSELPVVTENPSDPKEEGDNSFGEGEHELAFKTLKIDSDDVSTMSEYFKNPALLKVENGSQTLYLTVIKDPSLIGYIAIDLNGIKTMMELVSMKENEYIYRLGIQDIAAISKAYVYVDTPFYKHEYGFRFIFDSVTIPDEEPEQPIEENEEEVPKENKPPASDKDSEKDHKEKTDSKQNDSGQSKESTAESTASTNSILKKYQLTSPEKKKTIEKIMENTHYDNLKFDRNADLEAAVIDETGESSKTTSERTTNNTAKKDTLDKSLIVQIGLYSLLLIASIFVLVYRYRKGVLFKRNNKDKES